MTYSTNKCKLKEHTNRKLMDHLKNLANLKKKYLALSKSITLQHISFRDVRPQFKPKHYKLLPALSWKELNFKYYPSTQEPLIIYGNNCGLLVARVRIKCPWPNGWTIRNNPPSSWENKALQIQKFESPYGVLSKCLYDSERNAVWPLTAESNSLCWQVLQIASYNSES